MKGNIESLHILNKIKKFDPDSIEVPEDLKAIAEQIDQHSQLLPPSDGYIINMIVWWVQVMLPPMHQLMQRLFWQKRTNKGIGY